MSGLDAKILDAIEKMKWDDHGLIPAIIQDDQSKEVLMLAYMNRESIKRTIETKQTWFYSRSRKELWHKGATSGHFQKVKELFYDCDADTLLVKVEQTGPACHTGKYTCFHVSLVDQNEQKFADSDGLQTDQSYGSLYFREHGALRNGAESIDQVQEAVERSAYRFQNKERFSIVSHLEQTIAKRDAERPEGSYTTYLFEKGVDKILKKVGEEAAEVILAAKNRDPIELRYEISDLLFHVFVLMREQQLPLDEVLKELAARHLKSE